MKRLDAVLCPGSAIRAPADTALVLVPKDERPLRGEAGRVDWRLCGEISSLLESGFASGVSGESTLIPAGGPISASRLLLFGLGLTKHLGRRRIEQAFRRAGIKAVELAAGSVVLALPDALDLEFDSEAILSGLLLALEECTGEVRLCVVIPESDGRPGAVEQAAAKLEADASARDIKLHVERFTSSDA
jgi:hypothetical protein